MSVSPRRGRRGRPAPGSIAGTVTDVNGQPVANACVGAQLDSQLPGYSLSGQETDADGHYAISNLPAGKWVVSFEGCGLDFAPEFYDDKPSYLTGDRVTVADDTTTTGVDASLAEGGKLAGTVTGPDGKPLADICIGAQNGSFPIPGLISGRTDADGHYQLVGMPTSSYLVSFYECSGEGKWAAQFYDGTTSWSAATYVPVTVGEVSGGIDATMRGATSIVGSVVDENGSPMADVCVYADSISIGGGGGSDTTDAAGHYEIGQLAPSPPSGSCTATAAGGATRRSSTTTPPPSARWSRWS